MRLEKIVLHGFKSFAEKMELQIPQGVTAIVGPNGCGKCVSGETPVALADGRLVPIRELVETALSEARTVQHLGDGVAALDTGSGVEVLSLAPETLRLEHRPVEAFIKRTAPPFLLRVRTRSGREVVTTHYHPFFTLESGALKVLTAENLSRGVRIALPRCLPVKPRHGETLSEAVLSRFSLNDRIYLPHSPTLREWLDTTRRRVGGWRKLAALTGVGQRHLQNARDGQAIKVSAVARVASVVPLLTLPIEVVKSAGRGIIRLPAEVDGRLARFLGYLIAEGRTTKSNQVWFVNSDLWVTAEFSRLARELFGVIPRELSYKATVTDTLIFSRALCLLLDRVFSIKVGGVSAEKIVPPQILTATDEAVREFLSGLFEGDAHIHVRTASTRKVELHIEYVTASRQLAEEVSTLLLRLGVFALIRPKIRFASNTRAQRRRTYYSVYIFGAEQLRRLAHQLRFVGLKQSRLDIFLHLEGPANPNLDLVPSVRPLVRAAVAAGSLRIKPLRPLSPKLAAYVEGRCEASRGGLREVAGLVERHGATPEKARPLIRQLRALAESDVYWDEVVAIERISPLEKWVYDLTVAETHNFVAGNVIVHNSNIAEAVRWALGEQSPKAMRGHRMEDVIFSGSAGGRKPLGMAEVSLVFANDGTLPVPWSEVEVSRRLYRTGESEYLLNRTLCRLRDILDLFVGTGVNPKAYAIMDQDRLNAILTARPLDRRVFIEEAAGISRYKQQRAETLGKLEGARQNLLRVRDVMDEVKRQLGSLERQARKAQQYKTLHGEKQALALSLMAAEHAGLLERERALVSRISQLREEADLVRVTLSSLAAREATQRAEIQEADHRLGDLRQSVQKIQGELERLLERREQLGLQIREIVEEGVRLEEEIRLIGERRAGLAADREAKARLLAESVDRLREQGEQAAALEAQLNAVKERLQSGVEQLEALRLEQVRVAGERAEINRQMGELREREHQLLRRHEKLGREIAQCRTESGELASRRKTLEAEHARTRAELSAREGEWRTIEAELAECEARRAEIQATLANLRIELAARQSSLESLERLEREREGYGAGVRAIFSEAARGSVRGVVGTVADLLDVPAGLEPAVEAVLGDRLTWVVVERFEDAKAALAFLVQREAGPATFLPLDTLPIGNGLPDDQDGLRWAATLVGSRYPNLLHYLLGRVAVVAHLAEAEALWRRNGSRATYATMTGEVLSASGRLSVGRAWRNGALPETSPLGRKRAIRDASAERDRLEQDIALTESRLESVDAELHRIRGRQAALRQTIQSEEVRRLAVEKDLEQAAREERRAAQHLETLLAEERQLLAEIGETRSASEHLAREAEVTRQREETLERSAAELRQLIERLQADEAGLLRALTESQVARASLDERVEALKRELSHLEEVERDLTTRLTQSAERRALMAERRAELEAERERADHRARDVAAERDQREAEEGVLAAHHQLLLAGLGEIETQIRGSEQELNRLLEAVHAAELEATERRVRREELEQEARRVFGVDPQVLPQQHDPARDLAHVQARLAELEGKLEALGPVNLVADEEYRELEDRLAFLRAQHDDLVASIKDLEQALRGMTRTAQARFQEAFEAINRHFNEIFSRLFEGGRAELRLIPPEEGEEDPLETGVDLMAQPRGKRLQSITLLSGGEKALTGLALLFAIFYYRPSPFCVLDEVDAPLDDANIYRFLRVLREFARETQFVVITHNRKTMEAADVLYGLTMEEPGLSRLVSVQLT